MYSKTQEEFMSRRAACGLFQCGSWSKKSDGVLIFWPFDFNCGMMVVVCVALGFALVA